MNIALLYEVADLYGIEINDVKPNEGGFFFTNSDGKKYELKDFPKSSDPFIENFETIKLKDCISFTLYYIDESLLPNVA